MDLPVNSSEETLAYGQSEQTDHGISDDATELRSLEQGRQIDLSSPDMGHRTNADNALRASFRLQIIIGLTENAFNARFAG